jgi:ribose transport system permease protein
VIITMVAAFVVLTRLQGVSIRTANGYDVMQNFADLGLLTIGLAVAMIIGEFDLSVPSSYALGGTVAVLTGAHSPVLGAALATATGLVAGAIQGTLIAKFKMSSVPVTLGGYLVMLGAADALLNNNSVSYSNYNVGSSLDNPILQVFSLRSLIVLAVVLAIGLTLRFTRIGSHVRAVGSDRRAARVAGVPVDPVIVGVFMLSASASAFSGALLDYSLATASPEIQLTPLIFAVTAAVLGGVSVAGGKGSVLGVSVGVVALSILQEGLVVLAASDNTTSIVTGSLLFAVALIAAPGLGFRRSRNRDQPAVDAIVGPGDVPGSVGG